MSSQPHLRDQAILNRYIRGDTHAAIAEEFNLTRQRVKQITRLYFSPRPYRKYDPNDVLQFIISFKRLHNGDSPTLREICEACGVSSSSVAKHILNRLANAGLITQEPGTSRISVIGGSWEYPYYD